jgi:hypothetical protein
MPRPEDNFYLEVASESEEFSDTIIPDGDTWEIEEFRGNAAYLDDTVVSLIWDPAGANDLIACTHGDGTTSLDINFTGDGVKVLRLALTNDTLVARELGAIWEGRDVT